MLKNKILALHVNCIQPHNMPIYQIQVSADNVDAANFAVLFMSISVFIWIISRWFLGGQTSIRDMAIVTFLNGVAVLFYCFVVRKCLIEFIPIHGQEESYWAKKRG